MNKVLLIDIETSPNLGWVWGKWEQNVIDYEREWHVMCFSAKWLDGTQITKALPDYPGYKAGSQDDKKLIQEIWDLVNEAEIVIAHNGDQFDIRKINARFNFHKMSPPAPYRTVDTKKVAKRYFAFNSNKLDDLGQHLGLGRKVKHDGFEMWQACMQGDLRAWAKMKLYNKQDITLLERVYKHFLPWIKNHPNLGTYSDKTVCPKCGSSKLQQRGYQFNQSTKYKRLQCQGCGGWSRVTLNLQETRPLQSI